MAKELNRSSAKPQSDVYTLLVAVAAIALGAAMVAVFLDLKDFYGLKPEAILKPLAKAIKTVAK